jgi:hypothetical protein
MALLPELRPQHRIDAQLLTLLDEQVVESRKHHWVGFVRGGLYVVLAVLVVVAVLVTNSRVEPLLLSFLLALRGGWLLLAVWEDRFVVTDSRIFRVQGVLNQRAAAMSLSRIVDFTMEQPFWGQFLGYGHLVFENAAQDQGLREIRYLTDVVELNNLIQEKVFEVGGGPAKHKRATVVVGADPGATGAAAEVPPGPGGWGTLADPDATGEIPRVPDED